MTISNPVTLPAKKGHAAGMGDAQWAQGDDWHVEERGTGRRTKRHTSEESAIQAARRREWVK
jgi:uncharacterized protein DUF2188